ncbi:MAG: hypothetical protein QM767_08965 [Anaeromyxobacter sp.]
MHRPFARIPLRPGAAAAAVSRLANAVEARARELAPLIDLHRAHLESSAPGRARSTGEHALDLVALGLRWKEQQAPAPQAAGPEDLDRLVRRLAARRHDASELSRLEAWRDFARAARTPQVVGDALQLADWFAAAVDESLPPDLADADEALSLLRTELLGRALRRRTLRPAPAHPRPPAAAARARG